MEYCGDPSKIHPSRLKTSETSETSKTSETDSDDLYSESESKSWAMGKSSVSEYAAEQTESESDWPKD